MATATRTGQNSAALLLRIFLPLLAIDAVSRVRQRVEPVKRDVVATLMTLSKIIRVAVQAPKCLVDVPQKPTFLAGEKERLLAFHRVRALIGHVERITAQVAIG